MTLSDQIEAQRQKNRKRMEPYMDGLAKGLPGQQKIRRQIDKVRRERREGFDRIRSARR